MANPLPDGDGREPSARQAARPSQRGTLYRRGRLSLGVRAAHLREDPAHLHQVLQLLPQADTLAQQTVHVRPRGARLDHLDALGQVLHADGDASDVLVELEKLEQRLLVVKVDPQSRKAGLDGDVAQVRLEVAGGHLPSVALVDGGEHVVHLLDLLLPPFQCLQDQLLFVADSDPMRVLDKNGRDDIQDAEDRKPDVHAEENAEDRAYGNQR
mmetsp:Transcript_58048/g.169715  ORF Transcript_58048/g.169715 Transcript_58048/m.169715 type:complete len:212 (-) Transcript_58048:1203-1838(-)